ncbi:MAG: AraC family transcriptional regulator [Pseudomonadota bacterium]
MPFSFATFAVVTAVEILCISGLVALMHRQRPDRYFMAAFHASIAIYVLYHFVLSSPLDGTARDLLAPILANETLPGALLFLVIAAALFGAVPQLAWVVLIVPALELLVRSASLGGLISITSTPHSPFILGGQVYIGLLAAATVWLLIVHRKRYLMQTAENKLSAIYLYVAPAIAVFFLNLMSSASVMLHPGEARLVSHYFFGTLLAFSLVWQTGYLLRRDVSFHRVDSLPDETVQRSGGSQVNGEGDTAHVLDRDWHRVDFVVQSKELYRDPTLSLAQLAREVAMNRSQLSAAINHSGQQNFNQYINSLRVDYAKRRLLSSDEPVLAVAFDAGFNSKPTFNRVFKQLTGTTPGEFRRLELGNNTIDGAART